MSLLWAGVAIGIGATIAMDIWAFVLAPMLGQGRPNWAMPGRWFGHVFRGKLFHDDIGTAAPISGELALGWVFHYAVGILYGLVWVVLAGPDWLANPTFLPAWIYALITILAGWCLLQPGMGLGWFASKTPSPWMTRVMGLVAHTFFGLGLWLTALML